MLARGTIPADAGGKAQPSQRTEGNLRQCLSLNPRERAASNLTLLAAKVGTFLTFRGDIPNGGFCGELTFFPHSSGIAG